MVSFVHACVGFRLFGIFRSELCDRRRVIVAPSIYVQTYLHYMYTY